MVTDSSNVVAHATVCSHLTLCSEYAEPDDCLSYAELHSKLKNWSNQFAYEECSSQNKIADEDLSTRLERRKIEIDCKKPKSWHSDDFKGNVVKAEARLFGTFVDCICNTR